MKLKFNFNKRNRYKNICSIEGCNNSACGKYCNKHYHQIKRYGNIKTRTRLELLKMEKLLYLKMVDLLVVLVLVKNYGKNILKLVINIELIPIK